MKLPERSGEQIRYSENRVASVDGVKVYFCQVSCRSARDSDFVPKMTAPFTHERIDNQMKNFLSRIMRTAVCSRVSALAFVDFKEN